MENFIENYTTPGYRAERKNYRSQLAQRIAGTADEVKFLGARERMSQEVINNRNLRKARRSAKLFADFGPGYGDFQSFAIASEPLEMPGEVQAGLSELGQVVYPLLEVLAASEGNVAPKLFRIDTVVSGGRPYMAEVQIQNGALGLLAIEQAVYGGGRPADYARPYVEMLSQELGKSGKPTKLVLLRDTRDAYLSSYRRFSEQIAEASSGTFSTDIIFLDEVPSPIWEDYAACLNMSNQGFCDFPAELKQLVPPATSLTTTKGLLSVIWDDAKYDELARLGVGIDSLRNFVPRAWRTQTDDWQRDDVVIKVDATDSVDLTFGGRGVIGPWSRPNDRTKLFDNLATGQVSCITQEYKVPDQFTIKGVSAKKFKPQEITGANRTCPFYVVINGQPQLIGVEATISRTEPAKGGRDSFMTPVKFI